MNRRLIIQSLALVIACYLAVAAYSELTLIKSLDKLDSIDAPNYVEYQGISFYSRADLEIYLKETKRASAYPWARFLEDWMAVLLLGFSAAFLGGSAYDLRSRFLNNRWSTRNLTILGTISGGSLIIVAAGIPDILPFRGLKLNAPLILAVCFLGGAFHSLAWGFTKRVATRLFKKGAKE